MEIFCLPRVTHSQRTNCRRCAVFLTRPAYNITESGPPAPRERSRRLAIESIVSSSRFRARPCDAWTYDGAYSAIDWDPAVGLVVVGTTVGEIGIRQTRDPCLGCCSGDGLQHDGSTHREGIPVEFISGPSWSEVRDQLYIAVIVILSSHFVGQSIVISPSIACKSFGRRDDYLRPSCHPSAPLPRAFFLNGFLFQRLSYCALQMY